MLRHVVIWKFKPGEEETVSRFLQELKALDGVIPELKHCEVGVSVGTEDNDAILIADFDSMEGLKAYMEDPRHVAVANINRSICARRTAIDYLLTP